MNHATIEQAEIEKTQAESERIRAETERLKNQNLMSAEISKMIAETAKIKTETRWYVLVVAAGFGGVLVAAGGVLVKLLGD